MKGVSWRDSRKLFQDAHENQVRGQAEEPQNVPPACVVFPSATFSSQDLADATGSTKSGDPYGDGCCNLLEYAFGSDPLVPDAGALELGSGHSALVFPESPSPEDLLLRLEFSDDSERTTTSTAGRGALPGPPLRSDVFGSGARSVQDQAWAYRNAQLVPQLADAVGNGNQTQTITAGLGRTNDGGDHTYAATNTLEQPFVRQVDG